jgi:hypothetical protein
MRPTGMAIRSRAAIAAALALGAVAVALAGCGAGNPSDTTGSAGPAVSTPAAGDATSTGTASSAPGGPVSGGGAGTTTMPTGSGITGVTVVDGGCPVVRLDSPCPDRPIQAHLTVTDTSTGTLAATVDSDQAGHFRIPLPPGQYLVRPANPTGAQLPRAAPVTTTVRTGQFTTLTIRFDSGVR